MSHVLQAEAQFQEKSWVAILQDYRHADPRRSTVEILLTLVPFVVLFAGMLASLRMSYAVTLLLALPTAGFLVRIFMIQHDCGHGSFFRSRHVNDWVGRILGILTLTPYDDWRDRHAIHHATSGNLDHRGIGDIDTLTVNEYLGLSRWQALRYRLYRNPVVMFGLGPAYLFLLKNRFPRGGLRAHRRSLIGTLVTNAAILCVATCVVWLVGIVPFLMVYIPVILLASSIGVWLFFVQHQFEDTYWAAKPHWTHQDAALSGSSYYVLPPVLQWMSANIGIHHVHHLSSRIPFYRLPEVIKDHPTLANASKLTISDSLKCVRLVLWDEVQQRLISLQELRSRCVRS